MTVPAAPECLATPEFWDEACKHLKKRDRVMKRLIPQFGEARLQSRGDAFTTAGEAEPLGGGRLHVDRARIGGQVVAPRGRPSRE